MDLKKAEALLEKYWDGTTSLEEEEWLIDHIDELKSKGLKNPESLYFEYVKKNRSDNRLGKDFEHALLEKIEPEKKTDKPIWLKTWYWQAAALALIISLGILFKNQVFERQEQEVVQITDTYEDPQKAFEATKLALLLISEKLNKGEEYTAKLQKINELEQTIKSN